MEIFKIVGTVVAHTQEANDALNETGDKAEQTESRLSGAFQRIGSAAIVVGQTIATGLAVGITAMAALTGQALHLSGELEQNMGGSEAVFAEYAEQMQDIAGEAYANMGLSASDFLATANKMGALFQGAGFGIEESATISADAMQRAADVASIMGIDVASAMEAVAGAAKGNFTMMDNLGVAINDTTLQIYAMENGLGTLETTQDKVSAAMQLFMESTAYAAGNYARENQTLAGSLNTAKAAFQNFLTGVTSADQFAAALTNAGDVIIDNLLELTPRLIEGLTELMEILAPEIPGLLLESVLPGLIDGALLLIEGLSEIVPDALAMLGGIIGGLLPDALQMGLDILLQIVQGMAAGISTAIPEITNIVIQMCDILIQNAPLFVSAATQLMSGLCSGVSAALPMLLQYLPTMVNNISAALIQSYPILADAVISIISLMAGELPGIIGLISAVLPDLLMILADTLVTLAPIMIQAAISYVGILVENLPIICQALWDATPLIIDGILQALVTLGARIRTDVLDPAIQTFVVWLNNIKTRLTGAVNTAKEFLINGFNTAKDALATIADGIAAKFESAFNSLVDIVRSPLNSIIGFVNQVIDALNSISIDIPDWVPEYGGQTFGINIPNIAYLAKGGVITEPTLLGMNPSTGRGVVAGEAGDEAIAPIGVLQGYIAEAVASQNAGLVAVLERILDAILSMDENMGGNMREALAGTSFSVDNREFARLVKAVN
jgi:hypothetical protein